MATGDRREGQAVQGSGDDQPKASSGTWKEKALALRKKNVVSHNDIKYSFL